MNRFLDRKSASRVRRRERGRRGMAAVLWAAALAVAASGGAAAVWKLRLHTVRSVVVCGDAGHRDGLQQALTPCLGRRLWSSGADGLAAAYRKGHPEVEGIRTSVQPWGALRAEVVLRRPVARVDQVGLAIDHEGVVFPLPADEAEGLPVLRLAGSGEEGRRRAITALLTAGGCPASWAIDCTDPEDIKVLMPGPALVRLGNGRFAEKWARLREILKDGGEPGFAGSIDLRFHNQAVVRRQA